MKVRDYPGIETDALALTDTIGVYSRAEPDGYVRLEATDALWTALSKGCAAGLHDLSALWFDNGRMHMALSAPQQHRRAIFSIVVRNGAYPSVGLHHKPAMRLERAMRDLYGTDPIGLPDDRPWLDHGVWPSRPARNEKGYSFLPVEGVGVHQNSCGSRSRGHHRAGPFPL